METTKRRNNFVQSVDRAITVMELLSRRGWSGVTEVANELGINKSTAYRLLTTLRIGDWSSRTPRPRSTGWVSG